MLTRIYLPALSRIFSKSYRLFIVFLQLRGCQILDALRLHKQGFPEHLQYSEFRRRFAVLAPAEARAQAPVLDERAAVEAILAHLDLDSSSYRLGLSQVMYPIHYLF